MGASPVVTSADGPLPIPTRISFSSCGALPLFIPPCSARQTGSPFAGSRATVAFAPVVTTIGLPSHSLSTGVPYAFRRSGMNAPNPGRSYRHSVSPVAASRATTYCSSTPSNGTTTRGVIPSPCTSSGELAGPRKWSHFRSRRSQTVWPVAGSSRAVPYLPKWAKTASAVATGVQLA